MMSTEHTAAASGRRTRLRRLTHAGPRSIAAEWSARGAGLAPALRVPAVLAGACPQLSALPCLKSEDPTRKVP